MMVVFLHTVFSLLQLFRNGIPARKGRLKNLNNSPGISVKASSIALGSVQYKRTIVNNKIPGDWSLIDIKKRRFNSNLPFYNLRYRTFEFLSFLITNRHVRCSPSVEIYNTQIQEPFCIDTFAFVPGPLFYTCPLHQQLRGLCREINLMDIHLTNQEFATFLRCGAKKCKGRVLISGMVKEIHHRVLIYAVEGEGLSLTNTF